MNPQAQPQQQQQQQQLPSTPTATTPKSRFPLPLPLPPSLSLSLSLSTTAILLSSALLPPLLILILTRLARRSRTSIGAHLHTAALQALRVFALGVGYLCVGLVFAPVLILHQVDKH